jgi:cytochrome c-type protein NapC
MASWILNNILVAAAIGCAGISALLVIWFLIRRPALTNATKIVLLLGIGVLPIATAATGNVAGFEGTKDRKFCGSCHVMTPYSEDSANPKSTTLASRHARNALFGDANCYGCHANYGMFGTVVTKAGGMRHVYEYVFHYHQMSLAEAREKIHIREPFQNSTCMHCHSTELPTWNAVPEHASLLPQLRDGSISCASSGCHGPAHPFSKGVAK